jgi:tetratricopeptide (TPR) repeat protein
MVGNDFEEAQKLMQKAIDAEPANFDNYCQMTNIMMMKSVSDLDYLDSAALDTLSYKNIINNSFIRKALADKPNDPSLQALSDALSLSAIIYQTFIDNADQFTGRGDTIRFTLSDECSKQLQEIEKRMIKNTEGTFKTKVFPYNCLMLTELMRNNPDKALSWFDKGVRYNPRSQNLYENITGICAISAKKPEAFRLQLKLDSIHPVFSNFFMTAYFYYLEKNFDEAEKWTRKALELEPRNFYPLMGLAALNARKMKFTDAALYLDRAAGISPDHPDVELLKGILYIFDNSPIQARSAFENIQKGPDAMNEVQELLDRFWP